MKKVLYLIICLVVIQTKLFAITAVLEHYQTYFPGGYTTSDFSVCGSQLKDFKIYYEYCSLPGCGPANSCLTNANYRYQVTLFRNGSSVASHTFQANGTGTYDYFTGINVTPGTYQMRIVFQRSNLICSWITVNTSYSNAIVVSALPPAPVLSISGSSNPCHTNGYTYTVNGNNTGSGTYTWTSSNSTFQINGVSFPLTTSSNSVVINSTIPGSTSTISVTLNGLTTLYCGNVNIPSKVITSVSTSLSMYGPDCINPGSSGNMVATPAGTSGYTWQASSDNVNWGPNFAQTNSNISILFQTPGTYYTRVKRNLAGCVSNWAYWTTFCTTSGNACRTLLDGGNTGIQEYDISVYPNPSYNDFTIENPGFSSNYSLVVYDLLGKEVEKISDISSFDSKVMFGSQLQKGIYTVVLLNENERATKRVVKQ
jgi:Secretion system C-terminal sorting domain